MMYAQTGLSNRCVCVCVCVTSKQEVNNNRSTLLAFICLIKVKSAQFSNLAAFWLDLNLIDGDIYDRVARVLKGSGWRQDVTLCLTVILKSFVVLVFVQSHSSL